MAKELNLVKVESHTEIDKISLSLMETEAEELISRLRSAIDQQKEASWMMRMNMAAIKVGVTAVTFFIYHKPKEQPNDP